MQYVMGRSYEYPRHNTMRQLFVHLIQKVLASTWHTAWFLYNGVKRQVGKLQIVVWMFSPSTKMFLNTSVSDRHIDYIQHLLSLTAGISL